MTGPPVKDALQYERALLAVAPATQLGVAANPTLEPPVMPPHWADVE